MMVANLSLNAQEVSITLTPGWTWISCPSTESMDFATALGDFVPMEGDIIRSQWGQATYANGRWRGGVSLLYPGYGYKYKSNRQAPVLVTFNAQQPALQVNVATTVPTDITAFGMTCGGMVTDQGNSQIIVRGVCWSNSMSPTITDPHTTDGYGAGVFTSMVEGLEMNSTYYVRAYVVTPDGTAYGEQKMFSTKNGVPTLTTSAASEIGVTWATCGGDISDDGGMEVTERGICWSPSPNPTIEGNHGNNGTGLGSFTVNMNGLEANTTYYVRAYATNGYTTAYGNEISFHTEVAQTWPNGKLPGQFSVSETHQVQFSQGNLQYIGSAATPYWRFAEHQYDYFGTTTGQNSNAQDVDRDLFGWGTSGWDNGNLYYQPYNTESFWDSNAGYGYGPTDGTDYNYNLTGDYANADWGVYNAILNGGNASHQWRTLTFNEWNYLINTRATASGIRYAKAQVYGVNGLVVLPDDWDASIYALNYSNNTQAPFNSNVIADMDWAFMETNGAVFLPTSGCRYDGTPVYDAGSSGNYWSATCYNKANSHRLAFSNSNLSMSTTGYSYRNWGLSVRLVSVTLPEVSTTPVCCVLDNSAIAGGNITADGNADISMSGICYSTNQNPTIDDIVILTQGVIIGEFELIINELIPNTTYHVRAFATNGAGTAYGDDFSFTTISGSVWENGTLQGAFSVSADQQINFSQGNLQYIGSSDTPYWKFAEHQWDYLGTTSGQDSDSENVDRDLFGWGTSGYDHGAVCYQPWSTSNMDNEYFAYGNNAYNLFDQTGQADWGYNPISNGGNQENQWRTLTYAEWDYLLYNRTTVSGIRYAKAQVFGVNGVILLPDDWSESSFSLSNTNNSSAVYSSNILTASQWATFENAGAVFLPAAGSRGGTSVGGLDSNGYYWSASKHGSVSHAFDVYFNNDQLGILYYYTYWGIRRGRSVRLVRSISTYSIEATPNPAEGGTVTGGGNYNSDATCTLTATANEGYIFTSWTENGEVVSTEATYSFTATNDRNLVANFLQGAINGKFTISDNGDQVYFSQGNLQYQASTETWRFAENQWDYVGTQTPDYSGAFGGTIDGSDNGYISQAYSGWIDLFGWGTSGWDCGNTYYHPWDSNDGGAYYGPSGYSTLTGSYANSDWGVYNAIINGGNQQNQWRTLSIAEWRYLFNIRNTVSGIRYVKANVCNVNGLILLPDDWDSSYYSLNYTNQNGSSFSENIITASQWSTIEQHGAVFLPAAGYRNITNVIDAGVNGRYWSTSCAYASSSQVLGFNELGLNPGYVNTRSEGLSVRLVCNAE